MRVTAAEESVPSCRLSTGRGTVISIAGRLASFTLALCLLATLPSPAMGQVTLHELAQQRLEQVRERIENLTPEEIAQLKAARLQREQEKSARGVALKSIGEFACLPTCDEDDAQFLAIAGTGLVTLSDPVLDLSISVPAGTTTFDVGVFDGDGGLPDPTSIDNGGGGNFSRWDLTGLFGFTPQDVEYTYRLFASPPGGPEVEIDLTPGTPAPCPTDCGILGSDMLNDDWVDATVTTGPEAETPSGNFLYRFEIAQDTSDPDLDLHVNLFKVRTNAVVTLRLTNQPFSYISVVNVSEDFFDVFPLDGGFFNAEPTSYDGEWSFFFDVAADQDKLIVWDGDFDRGDSAAFGFTNQDTDDPDTPGSPFLPSGSGLFDSTADACFENIAQNNPMETCGSGGSPSGSPADNLTIPPIFDPTNTTVFLSLDELAVRMPSVRADIIFPDGRTFANDNPSGNQEWEQFIVSQAATCDPTPSCVPLDSNPSGLDPEDAVGQPCADVCLPALPGQVPGGVYEIRVQGVDMFNLNALRLPQILCVDEAGVPCAPLRDFLLGDTVFLDLNSNGVQDVGEAGIQGVIMELVDANGGVSQMTLTDASGNYNFPVDEGNFSVRVADSNFVPPVPGGAVGDLVWRDDDGNGVQDPGEPGIANVKLNLFREVGGDNVFVDTTITDENGAYAFTDLPPGTYFTDVVDNTVPPGLTLVSGPDPSNSVTIVTTEVFDTLDFGYQFTTPVDTALVGDLVWLDEDGDGEVDPGERGIGGVTLELIASDLPLDVFGNPLVLGKTQTRDDGSYLFTDVRTDLSTDYQVQVTDDFSVLTGLTLTVGPESNPNPTAEFVIVDGDVILDKDFGYDTAALNSISDRVWLDLDRDGIDDGGAEPGIDGVTVVLIGATGGVMDVTTTSGGGLFSFDNLPDGDYSLKITDLAGALDGLLPTTIPSVTGTQVVTLAGADVSGVNFGWANSGALEGLTGTTIKAPVGNLDVQTDDVPDADPAPPAGDGPNNLNYDFGYIADGTLGDRVWFDVDGDGTDNGGTEPGIAGVTVTLTNPATGQLETTTTDANGFYSFGNLRATNSGLLDDNYVVTVDDTTLPAGLTVRTFDLDGTGTPDTATASLATLAPGIVEDRVDVDFGYRGVGSIGDRVWEDVNGDGVQDGGEAGINGVTVELVDSTGTVIATRVTSGDGNYLFDGLPPGDYTVRLVPPAGLDQTFDLDLTLDDETSLTLGLGENRTDVDFGYRLVGSIGDRVWNDLNGDGVQDGGEVGINGVTVRLFDSGGGLVATDVTSGDGGYLFENLLADDYTVVVDDTTLPAGFTQTFDITPPLDDAASVTLGLGENRIDVDFGYRELGSIGDRVWNDLNGDGVQDGGETGINGVTVRLFDSGGGLVDTVVTSGDGGYLFENLPAGDYTIVVDDTTLPPGSSQTFDITGPLDDSASVTLGAGDNRTDVDFGYRQLGSIGDRVWNDLNADGVQDGGEAGFNGVTVRLFDSGGALVDTAVTSGDGNYLFEDLPADDYTVVVDDTTLPAGSVQTFDITPPLDDEASATLGAGEDRTDVDFGYRQLGSIGDRVWNDLNGDGVQDGGEVGLNGVTVRLFDSGGVLVDTAVTAGDGGYLFENLPADDYTVVVDDTTLPAGFGQTFDITPPLDDEASVTLGAGEDRTDVDFGYRELGSIGDRIWNDLDGDGVQDGGEAGINGVTVRLFDSGGVLIDTVVTAGDGGYLFENVPAGDYTVVVDDTTLPAGFDQTFDITPPLDDEASVTLGAGEDRTDVDFGYRQLGSIGDRVWNDLDGDGVQDGGEAGINGVTVRLFDSGGALVDTVVTAGDGGYLFENLPADDYTVVVDDTTLPAGSSQTFDITPPLDDQASVTLGAGEDRTDVDFGYRQLGSIGDRVWNDLDGDGVQDGGEAGINGVTVRLFDSGGALVDTAVTAGDGGYLFENLPADDYTVVVDDTTLPAGFDQTFDITPPLDDQASVALGAGEDRTDVDFGYRQLGSIGDRVWNDLNGDGIQDGGEAGINGVTVRLFDSGGGLVDTAVTAGDGGYLFQNLPADTYTVVVDGTTLPVGFSQTFDITPPLDNQATAALGAGEDRVDVDFGYQQPSIDSSLGDRVWRDLNGDGVQDAGETGINGVTVQLLDSGGVLLATAVTAGDGNYNFGGLVSDTYTVVVDPSTLPEGFVQTFDIEGPLDDQAAAFLGNGQNRVDVDFGYTDECLTAIDFETDGNGNALVKGQIIDDEWAAFGVTVSTNNPNRPAMIFDSANPTGGDPDLGTPNETFGGPGIGSGGEAGEPGENALPLGKVLIISEDGDSSDPDDNAGGGTITFDFAYPVRVDEVGILDIDEGLAGTVTAFDAIGNVIGSVAMANNLGNNSVQTVLLGVSGVRSLEIHFPGSGAVSGIVFCADDCTPVKVRDDFEVASFSNNDGPNAWAGDWIEHDPEIGGAGPLTGQVQVHDGLLTLDDYPNTGGEPSAAREVDLSGAASAKLSFTFATSSGVDTDDAVTVEISSDGGATWTELEVLTGIYGAVHGDREYDITAFASAETQVRFRVTNKYGGSDELFCLLFIEISSECDDCQEIEVRDDFETREFSNNDGADDWAGDWLEHDPEVGGAGPLAGQVQIHDGFLTLDDYPNTGGEPSIARQVDLSGAASASLNFTFATTRDVDPGDAVTVEISNDGGVTWTTLEVLTGIQGSVQEDRHFDISAFASAETQVRFRVSNYYGGYNELFCLLFIEIRSDCGGGESCQPTAVVDEFNLESFSNNDGPDSWTGDWIEYDAQQAGPWNGQVRVLGGYLKLDDYPDTGTEPSAAREVDLSGASEAIFSFDFHTTSGVDWNDAIAVEVSSDGGASWTILETITGISGSTWGWRDYDISAFASSQTQVRFRVAQYYGGDSEVFKVDWVAIESDCP